MATCSHTPQAISNASPNTNTTTVTTAGNHNQPLLPLLGLRGRWRADAMPRQLQHTGGQQKVLEVQGEGTSEPGAAARGRASPYSPSPSLHARRHTCAGGGRPELMRVQARRAEKETRRKGGAGRGMQVNDACRLTGTRGHRGCCPVRWARARWRASPAALAQIGGCVRAAGRLRSSGYGAPVGGGGGGVWQLTKQGQLLQRRASIWRGGGEGGEGGTAAGHSRWGTYGMAGVGAGGWQVQALRPCQRG